MVADSVRCHPSRNLSLTLRQRIRFMLIINKHFNFYCFRALTYTTLGRLCAVFLYNPTLPYVVLRVTPYIKCVVIHIYLYTPAFHSAICITVCGYTCIFTLKYTVLHTPALTLHHVVTRMVHVWLYIKHVALTFHCTACGYTCGYASRYTVIPVMSRIYTYVIVPYIFQHHPLCLLLKVR